MPAAIPFVVQIGAVALGASSLTAAVLGLGAYLVVAAATKPDRPVSIKGRLLQVREPAWPREIVLGSVRKSGVVVYYESSGSSNQYLHIILALAAHRVNSIGAIYFDGVMAVDADGNTQDPWAGTRTYQRALPREEGEPQRYETVTETWDYIEVVKHLGEAGTSLQSNMLPSDWTTDHRLSGVAAVYLRLEYHQQLSNREPRNITVDVEGVRPLNAPGSTVTQTVPGFARPITIETRWSVFSSNPALLLEWYLTDHELGIGQGISSGSRRTQPSEINWESLSEAVSVCDEQVNGRNRYECHGVIPLNASPQTVIESILSSCNGKLIWRNGQWHVQAGAYRTPAVSIDETDIIGGGIQLVAMTSREAQVNAVRGQFVGPDTNWQPDDYPAYESATYLAEDGNQDYYRSWLDLELPMTTDPDMCQQIARARLHQSRRQQRISFRGTMKCFALEVGETFSLTYGRWGWTNKTFEVESVRLEAGVEGGGPVIVPVISAVETDAQVWAWTTADGSPYTRSPPTTLPDVTLLRPPTPTRVVESYERADGTHAQRAVLTWTSNSPYIVSWDVTVISLPDVPDAVSTTVEYSVTEPRFVLNDLMAVTSYTITIKSRTVNGNTSLGTSVVIDYTGEVLTIEPITNLLARWDREAGVVFATWDESPNAIIRTDGSYNYSIDGAINGNIPDGGATSVVQHTGTYVPTTFTLTQVYNAQTYVGATATVERPDIVGSTITQQGHPDWNGQLNRLTDDGGNLVLDNDGTTVTASGGTGFYNYAATDLGTDDTPHYMRRDELVIESYNIAGDHLDDRLDRMLSWHDFDDANLTRGYLVVSAFTQFSSTDDDPDDPDPAWGAWSSLPVRSSRGVRWRIFLRSRPAGEGENLYYGARLRRATVSIIIPEET